jgi:hypothetical protein
LPVLIVELQLMVFVGKKCLKIVVEAEMRQPGNAENRKYKNNANYE